MGRKETIEERYILECRKVRLRERDFILHRVPDLDRLMDELLAQGPESVDVKDERLPYWAEIWPSSLAMGEWLLDEPIPSTARVLEIGCGPGLAGLAAAGSGCSVTLSDFQEQALELALHNWSANRKDRPATMLLDWRTPPAGVQFDVLLGSDVAYERRFFEALAGTFQTLLYPGGEILLTEPGRSVAQDFFPFLETHGFALDRHVRPIKWQGGQHSIACYRIRRAKE